MFAGLCNVPYTLPCTHQYTTKRREHAKKTLLYTIVGCLLGVTALVDFPLLLLLIPIIGATFFCFRGKKNPAGDVPVMPRIITAENW
jgi:hypothetical protein